MYKLPVFVTKIQVLSKLFVFLFFEIPKKVLPLHRIT